MVAEAMKRIVWDVDDVLNELMREWFERAFLPAHPGCVLGYQNIVENPPDRVLGVETADYLASLDAFRLSHGPDLAPRPELLSWFETHGPRFRHVALTSVPLVAAPISAAWVMRHFGRWIRTFAVIPSARPSDNSPRYHMSKVAWLQEHGDVALFLDDSVENVRAAGEAGIVAGAWRAPWNSGGGREKLDALALGAEAR